MPSRRIASFSLSGSGTRSSTVTTISGEVPQVTCGLIERASIATSRSNFASGSLFSVRQCATARSHNSPRGEKRSEEHTSELQSPCNLVCRLLLEKKNKDYRLGHFALDLLAEQLL